MRQRIEAPVQFMRSSAFQADLPFKPTCAKFRRAIVGEVIAVGLDRFANGHRPEADKPFKLTRYHKKAAFKAAFL